MAKQKQLDQQWAFNSATVMKLPWEQELPLLERFGWQSVEVWYDKLQAALDRGMADSPQAMGHRLNDAGIHIVGMCGASVSTLAQREHDHDERDQWLQRLDFAAAIGAPGLVGYVIGDADADLESEYQYLAGKLNGYATQAAERNLTVHLEFLGQAPINGTLRSAIDLIKRADHASLGLLFDLCHYYVSASHLEDLMHLPAEKLTMVHVDDARQMPMEELGNADRTFPGEGQMDVPLLLHELRQRTGYAGPMSFEIYDQQVWEMAPQAVFEALDRSITYLEEKAVSS